MPVEYLPYKPPVFLRNAHIHTIWASFRSVDHLFSRPVEEKLVTPDEDELYVDWYKNHSRRLLIISHGLEGNSKRPYVLGMAATALSHGWDVLAWNYRGCTGVPNRKLTSYHSGSTEDLHFIVNVALARGYESISLCGFSIGGNKTLLYLGREKSLVPPEVKSAVVFSVPCDLVNSSKVLAKRRNRVYMRNFLSTLEQKLRQKRELYPDSVSLEGFNSIKTFEQFDEQYTAPMNGFASAMDYWVRSSSLPHIANIDRPTALITALDDPFLSQSCYPIEQAEQNPNFYLKLTEYGGHVAYMTNDKYSFSEKTGIEFLNSM